MDKMVGILTLCNPKIYLFFIVLWLNLLKIVHKIPFVFILKKFDEGTIRQISNAVVTGKFDRDLIYCSRISTSKVPNFFQ